MKVLIRAHARKQSLSLGIYRLWYMRVRKKMYISMFLDYWRSIWSFVYHKDTRRLFNFIIWLENSFSMRFNKLPLVVAIFFIITFNWSMIIYLILMLVHLSFDHTHTHTYIHHQTINCFVAHALAKAIRRIFDFKLDHNQVRVHKTSNWNNNRPNQIITTI